MADRRLVMINGAVVAPERAMVSAYDRGFLYGDSIFETVRTYGGLPFALADHMARLCRSAERVFLRLPCSEAELSAEIEHGIREAGNDESYARLVVTRGWGPLGLDPDLATEPFRVLLVEPLRAPAREAYVRGVGLATVRTGRSGGSTAGAKVSCYLENLLAFREAKQRGAAEALLVDARGCVVEGATSNVFIVRRAAGKDELVSPPESTGLLAGVTRGHVLEVATELGIPTRFSDLVPEDVYAAGEVFITSSLRELVPAVAVDGRAIGTGAPGPTTRSLHRAFRTHIGQGAGPLPWERFEG
jgi:branched-chain amino acid aminotransferase